MRTKSSAIGDFTPPTKKTTKMNTILKARNTRLFSIGIGRRRRIGGGIGLGSAIPHYWLLWWSWWCRWVVEEEELDWEMGEKLNWLGLMLLWGSLLVLGQWFHYWIWRWGIGIGMGRMSVNSNLLLVCFYPLSCSCSLPAGGYFFKAINLFPSLSFLFSFSHFRCFYALFYLVVDLWFQYLL